MAEVTLHPDAEADYEHALAWYLDRSLPAADRFEAAFDSAVNAIRANPSTFPACDPHHRYVLLKRYPFRVISRIDGDTVRVLAVAHAKRRPGYWSDRA